MSPEDHLERLRAARDAARAMADAAPALYRALKQLLAAEKLDDDDPQLMRTRAQAEAALRMADER